jgi:hypothetical protein
MVSWKIWFSGMLLGRYDMAEETIERCLNHPQPFDRSDSADLPRLLYITRFVRDRSPSAAQALIDLIGCGIYRPGQMARFTYHYLVLWIEPFWYDDRELEFPVTDEGRALALAIGVALRAGKRHLQASAKIQTWEEFGRHIAHSAGFDVVEAEDVHVESPGTSL